MLEFPHADRVADPAALLAHARAAHEPHIGPVFRDTWLPLRVVLDAVVVAVAAGASLATGLGGGVVVAAALALAVLTFAGLAGRELSTTRLRIVAGEQVRAAVTVAGLVTMAVAAVEVVAGGGAPGVRAAVEQGLLTAGALAVAREGMARIESSARRHGMSARRALIVGAGQVGRLTAQRLFENPDLGLRPVGFLDKEPLDGDVPVPPLPVFGASWDLEQVVADQQIEVVIVAFSTAPTHVPLSIVRRCWELGVSVVLIPRLFEVMGTRAVTDHIGGLPLITLNPANPHGWQLKVKYALDRLLGALAVVVLAPVLLGIALAIRLTMGRPVLFRQPRLGRDGRVFDMLKFRTMWGDPTVQGERDAAWAAQMLNGNGNGNGNGNSHVNANGHVPEGDVNGHAPDVDGNRHAPAVDRRTALGRFLRRYSLDELPQLLNVVKGDMSLVGPRPERAHYADEFQRHVYRYRDRARIKPGLTGWAQVHGLRGETSLADRVEWDNFYIENWSPRLDLRIVAMTVAHVLREPQS